MTYYALNILRTPFLYFSLAEALHVTFEAEWKFLALRRPTYIASCESVSVFFCVCVLYQSLSGTSHDISLQPQKWNVDVCLLGVVKRQMFHSCP